MRIHERILIVGSGDSGFSMTDPDDCTVYLLECVPGEDMPGEDAGCVLIDAGCGEGTDLILAEIIKSGHQPEDIQYILLTHGHGDHAGGAAELAGKCKAGVYAMTDTARYVSEGDQKALSVEEAILAGIYRDGFQIEPCPVTPLEDGQVLHVGNLEIRARLTEGHCSGHGCYEVQLGGETVIFAGDSVFCGGKISVQSIWDCDLQKYVETCHLLEELRPDILLPSHGGIALKRGWKQIELAMKRIGDLKLPENL